MLYKNKVKILLSIIAALALAYVLSIVFEPERRNARSAAYTWLDPKLTGQIDRIAISGPEEPKEFVRKNNEWFVAYNGKEYPARQYRIEDFISAFTTREQYPLRSSTPSSHERLGLTESSASRVVFSGGAGLPLLDLLIGQGDQTGQNVYMRKQGQNDVRSGEDRFTAYVSSPRSSWYNLRLFPESVFGRYDVDSIQRISVFMQAEDGPVAHVFTRNGKEWTASDSSIAALDTNKVESYIRGILYIEGDDFTDAIDAGEQIFTDGRIEVEFGDGTRKTIRMSPPDDDERRYAIVSGVWYVFSVPGWATERLFRTADFFKQE